MVRKIQNFSLYVYIKELPNLSKSRGIMGFLTRGDEVSHIYGKQKL